MSHRATHHSKDQAHQSAVTVEDYAQAIARCAEAGRAIADYGICHRAMGEPPPPDPVTIAPPDHELEHWREDLSARISGGMKIGELQRRLHETGQFLPIDAADEMTLAEVIAHDVSGPLRIGHGTMRDLLLGLRYIDGAGRLITVGGRTVKNVAGYDVTRLMVGNYNTFGLIADANVRTAAIPAHMVRVDIPGIDPSSLDSLTTALLISDAAPISLLGRTREGRRSLQLIYGGSERACDAQVRALDQWLADSKLKAAAEPAEPITLADHRAMMNETWAARDAADAHVKIVIPPATTGKMIAAITAILTTAALDDLPAHGVINLVDNFSLEQAIEVDRQINQLLEPVGGLRIWYRRPNNTNRIRPFAPVQPDWAILGQMKAAMDPKNIFNPGRFPYPHGA